MWCLLVNRALYRSDVNRLMTTRSLDVREYLTRLRWFACLGHIAAGHLLYFWVLVWVPRKSPLLKVVDQFENRLERKRKTLLLGCRWNIFFCSLDEAMGQAGSTEASYWD